MGPEGRLTQEEIRDSAIRAYTRNIGKARNEAEMSWVGLPISKELLARMKKHPSPFSCYIDVINAFGEDGSQEYAPPDMREREAVAYANALWHQKPEAERFDAINAFARRIRDEEKDLPKKETRILGYYAGRKALVAQRAKPAGPKKAAAQAQTAAEPKKPAAPIINRIISSLKGRFGKHGAG